MNDYSVQRRLDDMQSEIMRLQRELEQRHIYTVGSVSTTYTLVIDVGNTLSDATTLGIKFKSSTINTVPSLYDPNVDTSFTDGIGRARLYKNRVIQTGYVLVVNDGRSGSQINKALFQNDRCSSLGTTSIPLAADATKSVTVYIPYFL